MVYRRPAAEGQGLAAAGPVDDAVSQEVSDSVHQAQEEQHLDDLAASTRQRQEAVQELTGSSAVYNNGSSAAIPMQRADAAASTQLPGMSAGHAGQNSPLPQDEAVPSSSSFSIVPLAGSPSQQGHQRGKGLGAEAATALPVPAGQQAQQSTHSDHSSEPRRSNAPHYQGFRSPMGAKKGSSLQGVRQPRGGGPNSTQS